VDVWHPPINSGFRCDRTVNVGPSPAWVGQTLDEPDDFDGPSCPLGLAGSVSTSA
jgi:hypothetical protein